MKMFKIVSEIKEIYNTFSYIENTLMFLFSHFISGENTLMSKFKMNTTKNQTIFFNHEHSKIFRCE